MTNNITLAYEVIEKIAGNFIFNPTAIFIIALMALGLGTFSFLCKHNNFNN